MALEANFRIRVTQKGRPISEIIKVVQTNIKHNQARLERMKDSLLNELNDYINQNRKRPKERHEEGLRGGRRQLTRENNLFNTIKATSHVYQRKDGAYVMSIGEYQFLNQYAPYWYLINYGGKVPNSGQFIPGYFGRGQAPGSATGQVFHYVPKGKNISFNKFMMIPKSIIRPMYYLNFLARRFEEKTKLLIKDALAEKQVF